MKGIDAQDVRQDGEFGFMLVILLAAVLFIAIHTLAFFLFYRPAPAPLQPR